MRHCRYVFSGIFTALAIFANEAIAGCVVGVSPGSALNIRMGPSTRFGVVNAIPADACGVQVTKRCRRNWCLVNYNGRSGWASMKFIDRDRVAPPGYVQDRRTPPQLIGNDWEFLGARKVDFSIDRDIIPVTRGEGRFRAIQVVAKGADVELKDLRITYGNGRVENIPVQAGIVAGRPSKVFDLQGGGRVIRQVEVTYQSRPNAAVKSEIQVYGLAVNVKAAPPQTAPAPTITGRPPVQQRPPAAPRMVWQLLDVRSVTFRPDRDVISLGAGAGRFRALQLAVSDNDIVFDDLMVIYANGRFDDIPIRRRIRAGQRSRVIDLEGQARIIREIRFVYKWRPPLSEAGSVAVYGLRVLN